MALLVEGRVESTTEGTGPEQRVLWRWAEPADTVDADIDNVDVG